MDREGKSPKGKDEESARLAEYVKDSPPGNEKRIPDWTAGNVKFTNVRYRYVPDSSAGNAYAPDISVAALRASVEASERREKMLAKIPPGVLILITGTDGLIQNPTADVVRDVLLAMPMAGSVTLRRGEHSYINVHVWINGLRLAYAEASPRAHYYATPDGLTHQDIIEAFDSFARRDSVFKNRFEWERDEPSTDDRNYEPTEEQRKKEAAAAADAAKQRAVLSAASFIAGRRIRPRARWNGERWENAGLLGETNAGVWAIAITVLVGLIGMFVAVYHYGQSVMNP